LTDRNENICIAFKEGVTSTKIGALFGITHQRVQQILAENGISGKDGGISVNSKTIAAKKEREKRCLDKHGLSLGEYLNIAKNKSSSGLSPQARFQRQKQAAKDRGIGWSLNFNEWWSIWHQSGKWDKRGRKTGQYVMCRYMDIGAYSKENVYIDTCSNNISDQYLFRQELTGSRV